MQDMKRIDRLSYADFLERFSRGVEEEERSRFYAAPNEYSFSEISDKIRQDCGKSRLHYIGIIGGVDTDFNYIARLDPEKAFLFDISDKQIAYLGLRLCLLESSSDAGDYYLEMMCASEAEKEFVREKLDDNGGFRGFLRQHVIDMNRLEEQGDRFIERLGYSRDAPHIEEVFFDPVFRKRAMRECVRYVENLADHDEAMRSWISHNGFNRIKEAAREDRIRGFQADIVDGLEDSVKRIIHAEDIDNLVMYISNVREWKSEPSRKDGSQVGQDSLKCVLDHISDMVKNMWVIESRFSENRIFGKKRT